MDEKRVVLKKIVLIFGFIALAHSAVHILVYGSGIEGFAKQGVSGLSIGELNIGDALRAQSSKVSFFSRIILATEWVFVVFFFIFLLVGQRATMKKNISKLEIKRGKRNLTETDIDDLYNLLREQKSLKLTTICALFGVSKEVALSWGRTLEANRLIKIDYPVFGDPDFVFQDRFDKGVKS